jgi:acylphosphatase
MLRRGHFIVAGRVQGVCFRMYAREKAERLGLTGWVRNCPDGTVEITAEGESAALREFRAWCAHGPPYARVAAVDVEVVEPTGEFDGFGIAY